MRIFFAGLAIGIALGGSGIYSLIMHNNLNYIQLPTCRYEDGNPDGMPCVWTDPDTGNKYVNSSKNYRD